MLAGGRFVGLVNSAQSLLGGLQTSAFGPEELDPSRFQGVGIRGRLEGRHCLAGELVEFGEEFGNGHGAVCDD